MKKIIWIIGLMAFSLVGVFSYFKLTAPRPIIRVGYFHGGRTMLLYRALVNDYFEKENLTALFYTKQLHSDVWDQYDRTGNENTITGYRSGKATGIELSELLLKGKVDISFIGEAAFIRSCSLGQQVVAIAQLGADETDKGGHSIVIKKGIVIKGPRDLEKIVWGTRRSSGGDDIFLKEFLYQQGVDLKKVKIISGIADDEVTKFIKQGKIQGAYHHLMMVRNDELNGILYTYRKLDWVDPAMSQALAIVTKESLKKNREIYKRFIRAYMKRIAFEKALPEDQKTKKLKSEKGNGFKISLYEMQMDHKGMNLPQYPRIPIIRKDITDKSQEMFLRHKFIEKKITLENCYDNSLVLEVAKEMYPNDK
jgi:ABC-type nitrate/sulfonate/bicarbonate transport system substrate-binding protein